MPHLPADSKELKNRLDWRGGSRRRGARPALEILEKRLTPSLGAITYYWTAMGDQTTWNDPLNWQHTAPGSLVKLPGTPTPYSNVVFPSRALLPQGAPSIINFNFSYVNFPISTLTIADSYTFTGNSIAIAGAIEIPSAYSGLSGPPVAQFNLTGMVLGPGAAIETAGDSLIQLASASNPTGLALTLLGPIEKLGPGRLVIDTQAIQYANSASVNPLPFVLAGGTTQLGSSVSLTGLNMQVNSGASLQIADNASVVLGPIMGPGTVQLLGGPAAGDSTSLTVFTSASVVDMFSGQIIGQGRFAAAGFGTLQVSRIDFAGTGSVVVQGGTLDVDGPMSTASLLVDSLGRLGGLGLWSITGSVVFQSGSTWNLTIDGATPGKGYTQISVPSFGQGVNLGGATLAASVNYEYEQGDVLAILAAPRVTGAFQNVVNGVVILGPNVPFSVGSAGGITLSPLTSFTTTSLTSSINPTHPGEPVTLTAAVTTRTTPVNQGDVRFLQNGAAVATVPVTAGIATYSTTLASVGSYSFQAVYLGTSDTQTSASPVLVQTVTPYTTNTSLVSLNNPSSLGMEVLVQAMVQSPAGPVTSGVVQFRRGSQYLGSASLSAAGVASLDLKGLPVGMFRIQAIFPGNATDLSSVSSTITQHVLPAATTTTLVIEPLQNRARKTQYELLAVTSTAVGLVPSGRVTFKKNGRVLGQAKLVQGRAAFLLSARVLPSGRFVAAYHGNANFEPSQSPVVSEPGMPMSRRAPAEQKNRRPE